MKWISRLVVTGSLFVAIACLSGCASAIYGTGKDKDVLREGTDRATIVRRFGEPVDHRTAYGNEYEIFRAEGKIAPSHDELDEYQMAEVLTLGVGEAVWLPIEILRWPYLAAGEKDVWVKFRDGKYVTHEVHHARGRAKELAGDSAKP